MLSIIVPVRNESENLNDICNHFSKNLKNLNYEVLIVNDFSEDNTLEKAKSLLTSFHNIKILSNKKKRFRWCYKFGNQRVFRHKCRHNDG